MTEPHTGTNICKAQLCHLKTHRNKPFWNF